jgi:large subunit ribosomal protein L25
LIDLKIGAEKTRPVLIRGMQMDVVTGHPLHIDFYQVNLKEKVTVPVPIVLIGDEPEVVHTGEAVVIQPMLEVEVEALPTDLPENIEVDITSLKAIDDVIIVSQLSVPEGVTLLADAEAVVAKLDNAVTEEMQQLLAEQEAEQAAAAAEAAAEEGVEAAAEGEEAVEGEAPEGGDAEEASEGVGNDQGQSGNQEDQT